MSTLQADGTAISWLSAGIQALVLTVPFRPVAPINPIHSVTIGDLDLAFDATDPWDPLANSNTVVAGLRKYSILVALDQVLLGLTFFKSCLLVSAYP